MWFRAVRNSLSSTFTRLDSGVKVAGRVIAARSKGGVGVRAHEAQHVLGQQHADDAVLVVVDDREARVPGLDHRGEDLLERVLALDHDHLAARDHDVAHAHLDDLEHPLDHLQGVGVEDLARLGVAHQLQELLAIARLAADRVDDAVHERTPAGGWSRPRRPERPGRPGRRLAPFRDAVLDIAAACAVALRSVFAHRPASSGIVR